MVCLSPDYGSDARSHVLTPAGAMQPYVWTINGATWANHNPVTVKAGERLEIVFHNMSTMGHLLYPSRAGSFGAGVFGSYFPGWEGSGGEKDEGLEIY